MLRKHKNLDAANAIIAEVYEHLRQWDCADLVCANVPLPLLTEVKNLTEKLLPDSQ
jgi:hypothetical protein